MLKLKKPFSFFIIFLIFILLVVLGISTYLLASGIRIRYDGSQKRYALNVSRNQFIKNLFLKYSKNLPLIEEATNESTISDEKPSSPFGKINEEIAKSKGADLSSANNLYNMAPEVVEKFKDDSAGFYFFRIGWGVDKVSVSDLWDYTKSAFVAEIVDYNKDTEELKLKITLPDLMPYFGQTITTIAKCDPEKSYLEKDGKTTNPIEDLSVYFVPNTTLFTGQCVNKECSQVGPFCKISLR
jgi:hypothetical protein